MCSLVFWSKKFYVIFLPITTALKYEKHHYSHYEKKYKQRLDCSRLFYRYFHGSLLHRLSWLFLTDPGWESHLRKIKTVRLTKIH